MGHIITSPSDSLVPTGQRQITTDPSPVKRVTRRANKQVAADTASFSSQITYILHGDFALL